MNTAAYLNWGRWVADCPTPGCGNALAFFFLTDHGPIGRPPPSGCPTSLPAEFHCTGQFGCGRVSPVAWPDEFESVNGDLGIGWQERFYYDDTDDDSPPTESAFEFKGDTDSPAQSWRPA